MRKTLVAIAAGLASLAAGQIAATAQDLPQTTIRFIGNTSSSYIWTEAEKTFIDKTFPEASKGRVKIEGVPHDQAGLRGPEILSLLQNGTLQFASYSVSYMAGDDPRFEGFDLAGLTLTGADARAAVDAYRAGHRPPDAEELGAKLLAFGGNPPQVFWCRMPIGGLEDLKGKKIRVFNHTMRDFLRGLGGTAVSMAFAEVVPALNNGVVDCASPARSTATPPAARGDEVTLSDVARLVGAVLGGQRGTWKALDPEVQAFTEAQFKGLEDKMWALGKKADGEADNCNTGKQPCTGQARQHDASCR